MYPLGAIQAIAALIHEQIKQDVRVKMVITEQEVQLIQLKNA